MFNIISIFPIGVFYFIAYDGVNSDPHRSYSGLRHAFRSIYMEHGWKGFYQVQFCIYNNGLSFMMITESI